MGMDDEEIKAAYRAYLRGRVPASRADCPSFEQILNLVDQAGSARQKDEIIDHVSQCGMCAEEFGLLRDIRRQETDLIAGIESVARASSRKGEPNGTRSRGPLVWTFAAALAGLLMIIGLGWLRRDSAPTIAGQGGQQRGPDIAVPILLKPERMSDSPYSWTFKWKDARNPESYRLEIFDEALFPVWTVADIKAREYRLPEDFSGRMPRTGSWFWTVTARYPDGSEASAPLRPFGTGD